MTMALPDDRRSGTRAPLAGRALVRQGARELSCEIVDIGLTGIALACPEPLELGDFVRVAFRLGAANGNPMRDADGLIARVEQGRDENVRLVGVQFTVVEGPVAIEIHDYVRRQNEARHPGARRRKRRTDEYARVDDYPPTDAAHSSGEFHVAGAAYGDSGRIELDDPDDIPLPATGTDDEAAASGADHRVPSHRRAGARVPMTGRLLPRNESRGAAKSEANAPIDRELLSLYLEALHQTGRDTKDK